MLIQSPVEFFRQLPKKVCPECGDYMVEQAESYIQECDRCLAKKEE
ncbi:protein YhfH [Bacillus marasmi]|nr:protein YhfH [Bacillus marasmi]